jgi:hypothetical protein
MHCHGKILNKLGGRDHIAELLRLNPERVKGWYRRGIAPAYWHEIAALAPGVTTEYLARTKRCLRQRQAAE